MFSCPFSSHADTMISYHTSILLEARPNVDCLEVFLLISRNFFAPPSDRGLTTGNLGVRCT